VEHNLLKAHIRLLNDARNMEAVKILQKMRFHMWNAILALEAGFLWMMDREE